MLFRSLYPLLVELDVKRDVRTGAVGSTVLEVVEERRRPVGNVVVLEVPERVEERVRISVLPEADAQIVLDWVAPADGDVMIVVSIPVATNECPHTLGELGGEAGWSVAASTGV